MACNCVDNFNKLLEEKFGETATCNTAIMQDGTRRMVVTGLYYPTKRDGTHAKNYKEVNLLASHCPFCGEAYEKK